MKWYRKIFEKEEQVGILVLSGPGPRISCTGYRQVCRTQEEEQTHHLLHFPIKDLPRQFNTKRNGFLESGSGIATFFSHKGNH